LPDLGSDEVADVLQIAKTLSRRATVRQNVSPARSIVDNSECNSPDRDRLSPATGQNNVRILVYRVTRHFDAQAFALQRPPGSRPMKKTVTASLFLLLMAHADLLNANPRMDLVANRYLWHLDHHGLVIPVASEGLRKYVQTYKSPWGDVH
jgi:hypothetical protein